MTSHTPGPWAYRGTLGPKSATHLAGPCVIEIAATGQQIAILSGWRNDRQIADAALMAAAPELLQALLNFVEGCSTAVDAGAVGRAAIAKAVTPER